MKRSITLILISTALILALTSTSPLAAWKQNGAAVCNATLYQYYPEITADGAGGAIIVWYDERNGLGGKIYAQRVDEYGNELWEHNGVAICDTTSQKAFPLIAADGAGGAVIIWIDNRGGHYGVFAQRIDASGSILWTRQGVAVCQTSNDAYYPSIISEGGGAIIAWMDMRSGQFDIYAQQINSGGVVQWTPNGVAICTATNQQYDPVVASDGASGAIIAWQDYRSGNADGYAQRINSSGVVQWTPDGVVICNASGVDNPRIISDTAGGAIIAWIDLRSGAFDVYAQLVNSSGAVQWGANGRPVCSASANQVDLEMVADGYGGAILAWRDDRGTDSDVYAQRINFSGYGCWQTNGVPVCTSVWGQDTPSLACYSGGGGGVIMTWNDSRYEGYDLFAQKIDMDGLTQWQANGVVVTVASGVQQEPKVACDLDGNAIIAWMDERGSFADIYAQRFTSDGHWGHPEPTAAFCRDVPGDQGGHVNVAWDASQYDAIGQITRYTIWRAISGPLAADMLESGAALLPSAADLLPFATDPSPALSGPVIRMERLGAATYYWELIDSQDAYYLAHYAKVEPTLFDSTAVCNDYHYFQIIAHTDTAMVFWISNVDSGYSVDNIAPCPPQCLAGEQSSSPEGLTISWSANSEPDLDGYRIYRGLNEDFTPVQGNLLSGVCDTLYFDGGWRWDSGFYYKVAALDVHGNESGYSLLSPGQVTGLDTPLAARTNFLLQNYPNPFNPLTTIRFGLKVDGNVSLRIYDATGRLIRVLIDGRRKADVFVESWDGLDGAGNAVASGVYFYRLVAGDFVQTKKMVLLR